MAKENFVVSANYKDRHDKECPWLIRRPYNDLASAVPASSVHASGVSFRESPKGESGFGCMVVAYCDHAEFNEDEIPANLDLQPISFDGEHFFKKVDGKIIRSCDHLVLRQSGDMFVVINEKHVAKEENILPGGLEVPGSGLYY